MEKNTARQNLAQVRERMKDNAEEAAPSAARSTPYYRISSASAEPLRRKLLGSWRVVEHSVEGRTFLESFCAHKLKGAILEAAVYQALYDFKDGICLKRVELAGRLPPTDDYRYSMAMALTWEMATLDSLEIRAEMGYQTSEVSGMTSALKELECGSPGMLVHFRFEGDTLVLEEGDDLKRLERVAHERS